MLSERFGDKRKMVKLGNKRRTISARYQVSSIYLYACEGCGWLYGERCVLIVIKQVFIEDDGRN